MRPAAGQKGLPPPGEASTSKCPIGKNAASVAVALRLRAFGELSVAVALANFF